MAQRNPDRRTRAARARAPHLPAERRRAQLLDAAGRIVLADGVRALTMERLAERAGVSKGLGYAYFEDVEDVALALWDREVGEVYRRVEGATDGAGGVEEGLRRAVHAYFDVIEERGALLGALRSHFGGTRMERGTDRRVRAFLQFWVRQVQQAAAVETPTAIAVSAMLVNAADAAARVWGAGSIEREEAERLCLRFLLEGFRGVAGAAGSGRGGGPTRLSAG